MLGLTLGPISIPGTLTLPRVGPSGGGAFAAGGALVAAAASIALGNPPERNRRPPTDSEDPDNKRVVKIREVTGVLEEELNGRAMIEIISRWIVARLRPIGSDDDEWVDLEDQDSELHDQVMGPLIDRISVKIREKALSQLNERQNVLEPAFIRLGNLH